MHILIATCGSHGDVLPVLNLAGVLQRRGHHVLVGGPSEQRDASERRGCAFLECSLSMESLLRRPGCVSGPPSATQVALVEEFLRENLALQLSALGAAARHVDVILGTSLIHGLGSIASSLSKPALRIHFSPNTFPSGDYLPPGTPPHDGPRSTEPHWRQYGKRFDAVLLADLNRYRRARGLAAAHGLLALGESEHVLLACDRVLAPAPSIRGAYGPRQVTQTGAWQSPAQPASLDPALERWLQGLPRPPLYAGFGSIQPPDRAGFAHAVIRACHRLERPLLLYNRSVDATNLAQAAAPADWQANHVRCTQGAPHTHLFPQCWAVVHHGGAGTVASAARAGVPQLVFPLARGSDQPFWATRIAELGIGIHAAVADLADPTELHRSLAQLQAQHPQLASRAAQVQSALHATDRSALPEEVASDSIRAAASLDDRSPTNPQQERR